MEWFALVLWALVALVALPLGRGAFAAPPLGLQPVLGIAGLVLLVLFAAGGAAALAWIAFGLGIAGAVTTGLGAAQLIAADEPGSPGIGRAEEQAAAFAGVAWPLYLTTAAMTALAALAADGRI